MALVPATPASVISSGYQDFVAVGSDGLPTGVAPVGDFPAIVASAYHDYASAGVVPGAVSGGGDSSIIDTFMRGATSNTSQVVTDFATALAQYWAGVAVAPGDPAHGGDSVVSVVNDALSKIALFESAINATLTTLWTVPQFESLISNIQTMAVSSIIWTVTESMPGGGTSDFQEAIT